MSENPGASIVLVRKDAVRKRHENDTLLTTKLSAPLPRSTLVFDIERPGSRSLMGRLCRISTRLLAYNLCFLTAPLLAQTQPEDNPE